MGESLSLRLLAICEKVAIHSARTVFQKRGNHSEVHLTEVELRIILQAAIQVALKAQAHEEK